MTVFSQTTNQIPAPSYNKLECLGKMYKVASEFDIKLDDELPSRMLAFYDRLESLPGYADKSKTPPGLKGMELAVRAARILIGTREHVLLPSLDKEQTADDPVPFNLYIPGDTKASIEDRKVAESQLLGFRMTQFFLSRLSPRLTYENTRVGTEPGIIAYSVEEDNRRALIGQRFEPGSEIPEVFNTARYGGTSPDTLISMVVCPYDVAVGKILEFHELQGQFPKFVNS